MALDEAGSVYSAASGRLERRVAPEIQRTAEAVIGTGGRPAEHMRDAWTAAFGRRANASHAHREAVKAIEAALKPIATPNDATATLGKMIGEIRAHRDAFTARLESTRDDFDPIEAFERMLGLVWHTQVGRHSTDDETVPLDVSPEQAQGVAVLAATIVHLVQTGGVRRR